MMLLSTLQFYAPSLWFLSTMGLAQVGPTTTQVAQATKVSHSNVQATPKPIKKKSTTPRRTAPVLSKNSKPAQKTTGHPSRKKAKPNCLNDAGKITDVTCVIKAIQANYMSANTLLSDFEQTYTYAVYQRTQTSKGKLFIKKPGKMRWDYKSPVPKIFVSNGEVLWVYEPNKGQAYQRALADSELPIAIRFLTGDGDLLEAFTPKLGAITQKTITAVLTPKDPKTQYKTLALVIDRASFMVRETTITDRVNNTNHVRFAVPTINQALPDSGFEFVPPKGIKIIR